jgi:pilus assembly protein FimV
LRLSFFGRGIVAALVALPLVVQAAGLGNLNVLSALGQRLNAEIEVVALQPGEDEGLTARLAPADAFKRAGVELNPVLSTVRFAVERKGGKTLIRMTSTEPLNEPFLDVLLEIQWPSGRLVREYTFLLDPPGYAAPPSVAAPTTPPSKAPSVAAVPVPVPAPVVAATPPKPAAPEPQAEQAKAETAAQAKEAPAAAEQAAAPKAEAAAAQPVTPVPMVEEKPLAQPAEEAQAKPEAAAKTEPAASKPPTAAEEKPAPMAASVEEKPEVKAKAGAAVTAKPAKPEAVAVARPKPAAPEKPRGFEVRKGDTLGEVAQWNLPQGVTMQQMLIALYRANPKAFLRQNINLVKAGAILNIPQDEAVAAIDAKEAEGLVSAHIAAFADYRESLSIAAAAAAGEETSGQRSSEGKIDTAPAKPAAAEPKDQVKLSKAEPGKPGAVQSRAAREDDLAARERALQEAQSRVSELEKNVSDLKTLLELKNQQLAELEKKGKPAPSAPPVAAKGPEVSKPAAAAAAPAAAAKAQPPEAPAAKAAPTPPTAIAKAPEAAKPTAPAGKAAPEAKPAPPAAIPAPVAKAPPPEKPAAKDEGAAKAKPAAKPAAKPEPGLLDDLIDLNDPMTLGGIGGVVLVLVGYAVYAVRRRRKSVGGKGEAAAGAAGASSVFNPAAQAAGSPSVIMPSVGQASVGGMGGDEVDPIAEADVYMAYGRDAQAEEILKEAIEKDPNRVNVHEKLLEIYANRRDTTSFAQTVQKLQSLTGGAGPEWEKAMALGRSIDPYNALYGGTPGAAPDISVGGAAPALDLDLGGGTAQRAAPDINLASAEPAAQPGSSIDFDLGMQAPAEASAPSPAAASDFTPEGTLIIDSADARAASSGLDFDLGTTETAKAADLGLNFELPSGLGAPAPAAIESHAAPEASAAPGERLEFDLRLDVGGDAQAATAAAEAPMDLSSISLDLGEGGQVAAGGGDQKWQEVATKLDLAKAYQDMGDKDGARELLNEVLRDGDPAQQQQAQERLTALA